MSTTKLDRRNIAELERLLRDELTRLQATLLAIVEENRSSETPSLTDLTAHATEALHAEVRVALMGRRTEQVVQIQDALERLSVGQYGLCQECAGFVGTARLRALPFARRCRGCQARAEREADREAVVSAREVPRALEAARALAHGPTTATRARPPRRHTHHERRDGKCSRPSSGGSASICTRSSSWGPSSTRSAYPSPVG